MTTDSDVFNDRQNFEKFLSNSRLQYIKLKFGNKKNLINHINKNYDMKLKENLSYIELDAILTTASINLYVDILEASSINEVAHRYSLYKTLTDTFWETTYWKTFSPLYNFIFDTNIKITRKTDLRNSAAKIVTDLSQDEFLEKWIYYTLDGRSRPVIQYEHLTIGPFGLIFSLHYREKELFGSQEPLLGCLVDSTHAGEDIVNWDKTDIVYLFSQIIKITKLKYERLKESDPIYFDYLNSIGYEFPSYLNSDLSQLSDNLKNKNNGITIGFYCIVQLSTLFLQDIDLIKILNKLIYKKKLVVKSEVEIKDKNIKVSKFGIVKRPELWSSKPAFGLASDIASLAPGSENFNEILSNIMKEGAIKYLQQLYEKRFELFQLICKKRYLYSFAKSNRTNISRDIAINLLLECYGLKNASSPSVDMRIHLKSVLQRINRFNENCENFNDETVLVEEIITNLRDGRSYLERGLKEWLYFLSSLIIYYEEIASKKKIPDNFVMDRPIFHIYYDRDKELNDIRDKFLIFLKNFTSSEAFKISEDLKIKIDKYSRKENSNFTLGDYFELVKKVHMYFKDRKNSEIWKCYPKEIGDKLDHLISDLDSFLIKEESFKLLNIASHGNAVIEFRRNMDLRNKSINLILKLDIIIFNVFNYLPNLITITGKVTEMKTGLEYYEFEHIDDRGAKIYGTRVIDFSYVYYFVPRIQEQDMISIYPILVTDLTDIMFD